MVSTGMTCVKYLLFVFNLIFAISGIAVLVVGAIIQTTYRGYINFLDDKFLSAPVVLIVVGAIVFVVAFFGCCGAVKENRCMIITFAVLLILIFILELAAGIAAYVKRNDLKMMLDEKMNNTMQNYSTNDEEKRAWDILQSDLDCCGANGPDDWVTLYHNNSVPGSCCVNSTVEWCTFSHNESDVHQTGCVKTLTELVEKNAVILGGVGIGIAFIQLVGVIFACCLARSIKKEYETV